jgi:hypothetical protein
MKRATSMNQQQWQQKESEQIKQETPAGNANG